MRVNQEKKNHRAKTVFITMTTEKQNKTKNQQTNKTPKQTQLLCLAWLKGGKTENNSYNSVITLVCPK